MTPRPENQDSLAPGTEPQDRDADGLLEGEPGDDGQKRHHTGPGVWVRKSVTVQRSPEEVYRFWRNFENLPRFMKHLESVRVTGSRRSHWKAKAPAGMTVEWDAELMEDLPGKLIAWQSVEGATIANAGRVKFTRAAGDRGTEVDVRLRYEPPGGRISASLARLFHEEPSQQVEEDLLRLKQVMEEGK